MVSWGGGPSDSLSAGLLPCPLPLLHQVNECEQGLLQQCMTLNLTLLESTGPESTSTEIRISSVFLKYLCRGLHTFPECHHFLVTNDLGFGSPFFAKCAFLVCSPKMILKIMLFCSHRGNRAVGEELLLPQRKHRTGSSENATCRLPSTWPTHSLPLSPQSSFSSTAFPPYIPVLSESWFVVGGTG